MLWARFPCKVGPNLPALGDVGLADYSPVDMLGFWGVLLGSVTRVKKKKKKFLGVQPRVG